MTGKLRLQIPKDATLNDMIELFNHMHMEFFPDDPNPEFQKWIYEHKSWVKEGNE